MATYTFTRTREQMRDMIGRKLGIKESGQELDSEDAAIVLEAMDLRLKELHRLGVLWWQVSGASTSITLTGGTVQYLVVVTNTGVVQANGTTVTDAMPTGIASMTWTCAQSAGAVAAWTEAMHTSKPMHCSTARDTQRQAINKVFTVQALDAIHHSKLDTPVQRVAQVVGAQPHQRLA